MPEPEGLQKLIGNLEARIAHLEKQMGHMIDHFNHMESITQKHEWQIHKLETDALRSTTIGDNQGGHT